MKKVTYPHMGNMNITVTSFLHELGCEAIEPPPITKKTMDLGVQNAPEFACLPLKVNLGNYLEAMELGADYILMAGGAGPCRFGYYGEVQREILHDMNKDIEMLVLEPNAWSIYRGFQKLADKRLSLIKLYRILKYTLTKLRGVDALEKTVQAVRPRSKDPRLVNKKFSELKDKMEVASSIDAVERVVKEGQDELKNYIDPHHDPVLKIGIVGEIYLLIEPFVNLHMEESLGDLGVEVDRKMTVSHWVDNHALTNNRNEDFRKAAKPYLGTIIGGHAQETVGRTVVYGRHGYDGVIQVAPFTCMPEIVAQSILPVVSKKEGIPVLSLFFDEHSGEAGVQTRLEAFVDMVRRKSRRRDQDERVSGN